MAMTYFHSGEADAPSLNAQAGSLVALLDAVLVNGFSSGATQRQPLGWTILHSDADRRAYKMPGGSERILYVDDTAQGDANDEAAVVRGYDSMSDIDTGIGAFPATGDNAWWSKRENGDSGESDWVVIGNESFLYFGAKFDNSATVGYEISGFGDLVIEDYMDGVVVTSLFGADFSTLSTPDGVIFGDRASPHLYPREDGTAESGIGSVIAINSDGDAQDAPFTTSPTRGVALMLAPLFVRRGGEYSGKLPDSYYTLIRTFDTEEWIKEVTNVTGYEGKRFLLVTTCLDVGPLHTTTVYRLED